MYRQLHVFLSNRLEYLYEELKTSLYASGISPFARRIVIVPSVGMRSWLQLQLAKDPACGIAAGLEIDLLEPTIGKLCRLFLAQDEDVETAIFLHEWELSFLFEKLIQKNVGQSSEIHPFQARVWAPLLQYLNVMSDHSARKSVRRLIALSDHLAMLFCQYGRYGYKMLDEWERGEGDSWQADLWRQLKEACHNFAFPNQLLDKAAMALRKTSPNHDASRLQIHLFGISFLSKKPYEFFMDIGKILPINYYLISPCQLFWSDIYSDKEAFRLKSYWANKSISESQQLALDEFLWDRNILLGNFGRMGREMAMQIEETIDNTVEHYLLSEAIKQIPQYAEALTDETIFEPSEGPLSLLQAIQTDMTLLRTFDPNDKIVLEHTDDSLQLHIAPTKQREVEILYNVLVGLLSNSAASASPLTPSDIIVMVPDLIQYEAAIKSVFGCEGSLLAYQLCEMRMAMQSSFVQGFLQLLSFGSGRWKTADLLGLLDYPAFRRKQGISYEDVQQIEKWIERSGVYWGQTLDHRAEILQRDHHHRSPVDKSQGGTWDYSVRRLLMGIVVEATGLENSDSAFTPPLEGIDISQTPLISKWILLLKSLQDDLKPISDGTKMTLKEWSSYLIYLKNSYFQSSMDDSEFCEEEGRLTDQIEEIGSAGKWIAGQTFGFESIISRLENCLKTTSLSLHDMHLQAVKFCPLLPMRALPARVIAMLGMQEDIFPKKETTFALNEIPKHPLADYFPSASEFDRYLFLEVLLSVREKFLLSYVGYSFDDQKECAPSLVIQELLNYIDAGYTVGGRQPSEYCTRRHPFQSFDYRYFSRNSNLKSYRQLDYRLAEAYYTSVKENDHRFIFDFTSKSQTIEEDARLDLKDLASFASNPLKIYFNRTLGIYLKIKPQRSEHESFVLGALEKYQMRKMGVYKPFSPLVEAAAKRGELPPGMFKILAVNTLKRDIEEMHANFASMGVNPVDLFSVRFSEKCVSPCFTDDKVFLLPPLQLATKQGRLVKIVGSLHEVSSVGLFYHQDRDFKSLLKIWPQYLALQCAVEQFHLPIECQAVSSKHSQAIALRVENPSFHLLSFIEYYYTAMHCPSLLLPEWVEPILVGSPEMLHSRMRASFESPFSAFYNEYALWLFRDLNALPAPEKLLADWRPLAFNLFSGLFSIVKEDKKR